MRSTFPFIEFSQAEKIFKYIIQVFLPIFNLINVPVFYPAHL